MDEHFSTGYPSDSFQSSHRSAVVPSIPNLNSNVARPITIFTGVTIGSNTREPPELAVVRNWRGIENWNLTPPSLGAFHVQRQQLPSAQRHANHDVSDDMLSVTPEMVIPIETFKSPMTKILAPGKIVRPEGLPSAKRKPTAPKGLPSATVLAPPFDPPPGNSHIDLHFSIVSNMVLPFCSRKGPTVQSSRPTLASVFTCDIPGCRKCFGRLAHLQQHLQTLHEQEKPYVCVCGKKFSRRDNFHAHHRRVHGGKDAMVNGSKDDTADKEDGGVIQDPAFGEDEVEIRCTITG